MNHRRFRPDVVPDQRRDNSNQHHGGHEHRRNLVRKPSNGRLRALGFFHQLDDLSQRSVTANPGGLVDNGTTGVEGAGRHLIAFRFAHRHGLTGEHALINASRAFGNHAIDRQFLTGSYPDVVALENLLYRNVLLFTIPNHPRGFRPQVQQPAHRLRCLAFGPKLQGLTQVDQADDHRRGLKVDMASHLRQRAGNTGDDNGIKPGGAGTQGNQGVHVGVMVPECLPSTSVEVSSGSDHYPKSENAQVQPGELIGIRHHHGVETHAVDHQPKTQAQTHGHLYQQCLVLLPVFLLLACVRFVLVLDHAGAITGIFYCLHQRLGIGITRGRGGIVRQVHMGMADTGDRHQGLLNGVYTGRTGSTGHGQMNLPVRTGCCPRTSRSRICLGCLIFRVVGGIGLILIP